MTTKTATKTKKSAMTYVLWTVQVLLAALFIFAGGMKLVMDGEALAAQSTFPLWFLRFIGVAELAGGLGLVLPGIFRIRQGLTPLAAIGLLIIMIGAVVVSADLGGASAAAIPFGVALGCAFVAYGRGRKISAEPIDRPNGIGTDCLPPAINTRSPAAAPRLTET